MRGDFSGLLNELTHNFNGVLHQQGRVLLDRDWNAQTIITNDWQDVAGQDIIGAGVAAVPADVPQSFKVTAAQILNAPNRVELTVKTGHIWADGLLTYLRDGNLSQVQRIATYLKPPVQTPQASIPVNPPNNPLLRDAVILELWREEMNAFQLPNLLVEPALGGVDTTERVHTAFRFRLYRMDDDDTCDSLINQLKDDFDNKGKLTVTLQPDTTTNGDCPTVAGGGYTGFEHQLYRVEIAETDTAVAMFKWSSFNGGLVGRGRFDDPAGKITITANQQAILRSGLQNFYLETVEYDPLLGYWRVTYGAKVSLDSNGYLTLPATPTNHTTNPAQVLFGTLPTPNSRNVFFRLWNDIREVNAFTAQTELQDDIRLQFDTNLVSKYTPNDYWTFQVRAGEIANKQVEIIANIPTLINNKPPEGIHYHRVPLAELTWNSSSLTDPADIEDCRRIFQPLTKLKGCCSYRVGDGTHSHGDFTSIQEAINHLPLSGGEICILPGVYKERVVIDSPHNRNITLKGCGRRSRIEFEDDRPVIHVKESQNIKIESLAIQAHENGVGILLEGPEQTANDNDAAKARYLKDICLEALFIRAARQSAIEAHVGQFITVRNNVIHIQDEDTERAAIYLAGDDMLVEENEIRVLPQNRAAGGNAVAEFDITNDPAKFVPAQRATGGLQLGGGSERVRVINNLIVNGVGNGITLGSVDIETNDGIVVSHDPPFEGGDHDDDICNPNPGHIDDDDDDDGTTFVAGAPLKDILIKFNRIFNMGRNGIGVVTFFNINGNKRELITVEDLVIDFNRIERCMNRAPQAIPGNMTDIMGYGGITLADVENLVVRDNFINDNGPDYLEPICGIFVLHGEGIEISRNQILNNGARTQQELTPSVVKNGVRGGIFIAKGIAPRVENNNFGLPNNNLGRGKFTFPSGLPAIKIHDNIVSVPLGRALTLGAIGATSIIGNQFTSLGVVPGFSLANLTNILAGTVFIYNLGISFELASLLLSFQGIKQGSAASQQAQLKQNVNATNTTASLGFLRQLLDGGNVLFANNQCRLNLTAREQSFSLTSIIIFSLDDIGFLGNQCDCDLVNDFIITQAIIFGISVRVNDNRFKETIGRVLFFLSAVTMGLLNTTTDNESTHCLLILGTLYLKRYNLTMIDAFTFPGDVTQVNESYCRRIGNLFDNFGRGNAIGQAQPVAPVETNVVTHPFR